MKKTMKLMAGLTAVSMLLGSTCGALADYFSVSATTEEPAATSAEAVAEETAPAAAEEAAAEEAAAEEAAAEEAAAEEAAAEETAAEETAAEETATEETATEETAAEETAAEETAAEETAAEETVTEEPAEETITEEPVVEEEPATEGTLEAEEAEGDTALPAGAAELAVEGGDLVADISGFTSAYYGDTTIEVTVEETTDIPDGMVALEAGDVIKITEISPSEAGSYLYSVGASRDNVLSSGVLVAYSNEDGTLTELTNVVDTAVSATITVSVDNALLKRAVGEDLAEGDRGVDLLLITTEEGGTNPEFSYVTAKNIDLSNNTVTFFVDGLRCWILSAQEVTAAVSTDLEEVTSLDDFEVGKTYAFVVDPIEEGGSISEVPETGAYLTFNGVYGVGSAAEGEEGYVAAADMTKIAETMRGQQSYDSYYTRAANVDAFVNTYKNDYASFKSRWFLNYLKSYSRYYYSEEEATATANAVDGASSYGELLVALGYRENAADVTAEDIDNFLTFSHMYLYNDAGLDYTEDQGLVYVKQKGTAFDDCKFGAIRYGTLTYGGKTVTGWLYGCWAGGVTQGLAEEYKEGSGWTEEPIAYHTYSYSSYEYGKNDVTVSWKQEYEYPETGTATITKDDVKGIKIKVNGETYDCTDFTIVDGTYGEGDTKVTISVGGYYFTIDITDPPKDEEETTQKQDVVTEVNEGKYDAVTDEVTGLSSIVTDKDDELVGYQAEEAEVEVAGDTLVVISAADDNGGYTLRHLHIVPDLIRQLTKQGVKYVSFKMGDIVVRISVEDLEKILEETDDLKKIVITVDPDAADGITITSEKYIEGGRVNVTDKVSATLVG